MKLNFAKVLRPARERRVEPCHWSEGYVGVSLQERRATMQVMLGMSLRAIWEATLVCPMRDELKHSKISFFHLQCFAFEEGSELETRCSIDIHQLPVHFSRVAVILQDVWHRGV